MIEGLLIVSVISAILLAIYLIIETVINLFKGNKPQGLSKYTFYYFRPATKLHSDLTIASTTKGKAIYKFKKRYSDLIIEKIVVDK